MSLNKVVKISSNQGGRFTASNNLVDFDIPADGVYDLSKSYVNLMCSVNSVDSDGGNQSIFVPQILLNNDDGTTQENKMSNVAFVKNMSLSSQNKGQIADIRRVDVLRNNLNEYMLSQEEKDSLDNESAVSSYNQNHQLNSIFREIRKEGSKKSENRQSPIRIPLSQLCNFGKVRQYDTTKYGKTRLHLELNLDRVNVGQYLGNDGAGGGNSMWKRGQQWNSFKDMTVARDSSCGTLDTSINFKNLEDSPYWVGQRIRVSATAGGGRAGGNITNQKRTITAINFLKTTAGGGEGQITITLDEPLQNGQGVLTGGETYTATTADGDDGVHTFSCDYGELVLTKITTPQKGTDTITYTEFSTEEHNANGVQNFQRQFTIEPECVNVFIMKNEDIISKRGDLSDWRLRLNNEDLTNRPVYYNSALSLDRINMTLGNSNNKLHNANQQNQRVLTNSIGENIPASNSVNANQILLICNPVPQTQQDKMLQVNINCATASLNKMCLFKECIRVI